MQRTATAGGTFYIWEGGGQLPPMPPAIDAPHKYIRFDQDMYLCHNL